MPFNDQILKRLDAALAKRQSLRKITNAMRLVNSLGDGLEGLVLERYDKHFVAQVFHPRWLQQSASLQSFLTNHFSVEYLIIKDRTQSSSSEVSKIGQQVLIAKTDSRAMVKENGLVFEVDLNDTLNTGLFLDMRRNRKFIGEHCRNKKVLNCFAYTCSFGVYAKASGAKEVINVDISKKVLGRGKRNYELNHLAVGQGEMVRADAVSFLERAVKKGNHFDVIILDPPSFARADGKIFSVKKDLPRMAALAHRVLKPSGKLFLSTNNSAITHRHLEGIAKGFKQIQRLGQDVDFTGTGLMKESYLVALWAAKS